MNELRECSSGLRNVALLFVYEAANDKQVSKWDEVTEWWLGGVDLSNVEVEVHKADVARVDALDFWRDKGGLSLDLEEVARLGRGESITLYPRRVDDSDLHWDFYFSD